MHSNTYSHNHTQTHTYTGKQTHTHRRAHTRTHACSHACMHPCSHKHAHTDGHTRTRTRTHKHTNKCKYSNAFEHRDTDMDKKIHLHTELRWTTLAWQSRTKRCPYTHITANQCTANTKSCSMTGLRGYCVVACVRKCTAYVE